MFTSSQEQPVSLRDVLRQEINSPDEIYTISSSRHDYTQQTSLPEYHEVIEDLPTYHEAMNYEFQGR
jgi:hypothetical protein